MFENEVLEKMIRTLITLVLHHGDSSHKQYVVANLYMNVLQQIWLLLLEGKCYRFKEIL